MVLSLSIPTGGSLLFVIQYYTSDLDSEYTFHDHLYSLGWSMHEAPNNELGPEDAAAPPPSHLISTDPGTIHCAVVRYDGKTDRFTHARLYNLLCTCKPEMWGTGPLEKCIDEVGEVKPKKKKRPPKVHEPTSHEFASQLMQRIQYDSADGKLFSKAPPIDLAVTERQNAMDTGNMTVQSAMVVAHHGKSRLQNPNDVKAFWNQVAAASPDEASIAFRRGSHQINKTDSIRMGPRVLSLTEQALFRRAAERNAAHKQICPVMVQRRRRQMRKAKKNSTTPSRRKKLVIKLDDLIDAGLQAIYVYQTESGMNAADRRGPAMKRLRRGDLRLRLEKEAKEAEKIAKATRAAKRMEKALEKRKRERNEKTPKAAPKRKRQKKKKAGKVKKPKRSIKREKTLSISV